MVTTQTDDTGRRSMWEMIKSCSGTARDRQNQYRFTAWILAWAVSFVGAAWVLKHNPQLEAPVTWLLAFGPTIFGIGALLSYLRFLRQADELLQKIQLEGLAIGFGAGAIFSMGYSLFERVGAPTLDIGDMLAVMMFGWVIGQLVSMRRYR